MRITDILIQKNQNAAKKKKKKIENRICVYKMAVKTLISNSLHKIANQLLENHFSEGIFHKILLISEDYKYYYIAERKIVKKLFGCAFMGKTNFEKCACANLC